MRLDIKTIATYRDRVKQKLGIKTAVELIRRAILRPEQDRQQAVGRDDRE